MVNAVVQRWDFRKIVYNIVRDFLAKLNAYFAENSIALKMPGNSLLVDVLQNQTKVFDNLQITIETLRRDLSCSNEAIDSLKQRLENSEKIAESLRTEALPLQNQSKDHELNIQILKDKLEDSKRGKNT